MHDKMYVRLVHGPPCALPTASTTCSARSSDTSALSNAASSISLIAFIAFPSFPSRATAIRRASRRLFTKLFAPTRVLSNLASLMSIVLPFHRLDGLYVRACISSVVCNASDTNRRANARAADRCVLGDVVPHTSPSQRHQRVPSLVTHSPRRRSNRRSPLPGLRSAAPSRKMRRYRRDRYRSHRRS